MSSTPWTVRRNKRKSPATTSTVRKRARFSDDVVRRSSTPRSNSQKTLTQIAFVGPSPTSHAEDTDLQEISTSNRRRSRSSTSKPRRLKKQDSTLTQMPWLATSKQPNETIDYELLSPSFVDAPEQPPFSQHDGANDTPLQIGDELVLGFNHTTTLTPSIETGQMDKISAPARKVEKGSIMSGRTSASERRRSGRIASKTRVLPDEPSDSPKISRLGQYTAADRHPRTTTYHPAPLLEIQDSTEFDEHLIDFLPLSRPSRYDRPQTPSRDYIASSQTPETAVRNTAYKRQRRDISPSKTVGTPLQERSTNILAVPRSSVRKRDQNTRNMNQVLESRGNLSPPRKTCVLKVSGRALLPRTRRVDDSQQDVYSLQATSSPRREKGIQKNSSTEQSTSGLTTAEEASGLSRNGEIGSSPPELDTQASLPQLEDLIPSRKLVEASTKPRKDNSFKTRKDHHHQGAAGDAIDTQDFYRDRPEPTRTDADQMLLDVEAGVDARGIDEAAVNNPPVEVDESEVEFGSPILNDTQFNSEIKHRTSSPTSITGTTISEEQKRLSDTVEISTPTQQRRTQVTFADVPQEHSDTDEETSLPTPRLVKRVSSTAKQSLSRDNDNEEETDEPVLPRPAHQSNTHVSTSKISLNDMSSSSMPLTVPTQIITTQKSIHPASMPRPSQMSTQDPTQSYFFSSIVPPTNHSHAAERISIKDSSSSDGHLHEIPIHIGQSQSQDRPLKLVIEDSEEEMDDLDLDPATGSKYSARKPISRQVTKNSSSLKSIHISTSSSSVQKSSSPTSRSRTVRLLTSKRKRVVSEEDGIRENIQDEILDVLADVPTSSPTPPPSKRQRLPIPGFDNDTQSDFTQNGHVTAAYIHKQRELGRYPEWFVPKPTSVGGRAKRK